jgi:hypothetical protein
VIFVPDKSVISQHSAALRKPMFIKTRHSSPSIGEAM